MRTVMAVLTLKTWLREDMLIDSFRRAAPWTWRHREVTSSPRGHPPPPSAQVPLRFPDMHPTFSFRGSLLHNLKRDRWPLHQNRVVRIHHALTLWATAAPHVGASGWHVTRVRVPCARVRAKACVEPHRSLEPELATRPQAPRTATPASAAPARRLPWSPARRRSSRRCPAPPPAPRLSSSFSSTSTSCRSWTARFVALFDSVHTGLTVSTRTLSCPSRWPSRQRALLPCVVLLWIVASSPQPLQAKCRTAQGRHYALCHQAPRAVNKRCCLRLPSCSACSVITAGAVRWPLERLRPHLRAGAGAEVSRIKNISTAQEGMPAAALAVAFLAPYPLLRSRPPKRGRIIAELHSRFSDEVALQPISRRTIETCMWQRSRRVRLIALWRCAESATVSFAQPTGKPKSKHSAAYYKYLSEAQKRWRAARMVKSASGKTQTAAGRRLLGP